MRTLLLLSLGCSTPSPAPDAAHGTAPSPTPSASARPAPAPVPEIPPITDAAGLRAVLALPLERGSCREGKIRVEGKTVLDAREPDAFALLLELVGTEPLDEAAVAVGVLWDTRTPLPAERADALVQTLVALHGAPASELGLLDCRKLKAVQGDGIVWNARGDGLALLAAMEDRPTVERAVAAYGSAVPEARDASLAAIGDADALHELDKRSLKQLCDGRTWETSWLLRAIDIGRHNGSLLPLGQMQTGACEMLARGVDPEVVTPRQ
ncbi:MAG: hypothetical protein R3F61_39010 [Myxococcota bacterium]